MSRLRAAGAAPDAGFTLMEMLVGMTLMLVVFAIVLDVTGTFQRQANATELRGDADADARNAVDQMTFLLRNAVSSTPGSADAVERSGSYDLIFLANDPASPGAKIHVRYCVDNSTPTERLLQQTAPSTAALPSTACPDTTTTGWTTAAPRVLASDIVNLASLSSPVPAWAYDTSGSTIVAVEVHLLVDPDPNQLPAANHLRTRVALRNVNRPPIAAVTCQLRANRHVVCDASASADPEGEPLSYAWSYGPPATPSPITSPRFDQALAPGTYTFTVTVTDPGGLAASATSTPVTVT